MNDIKHIEGDTFSYSPVQMLESVINEIESGNIDVDNVLIIMGKQTAALDVVYSRKAQLHSMDAVLLMERLKYTYLRDYID